MGNYIKAFIEYQSEINLEIGNLIHNFITVVLKESGVEHKAKEKKWVVQPISQQKILLSGYFEKDLNLSNNWQKIFLSGNEIRYRLSNNQYEELVVLNALPQINELYIENISSFTLIFKTPTTLHNRRFYPFVTLNWTRIAKINVETKMIQIKSRNHQYRITGTVGKIVYEFIDDLPNEDKLNLLNYLKEAEWIGLGAKNSYGLGNVVLQLNLKG